MTEQPAYEGLAPGMAEWWIAHLDQSALVVIRCGRRDAGGKAWCQNAIGEIKRDGDRVLAMSKNEHPESEARWLADPPTEGLSDAIAEELASAIAERDTEALRHYDDGLIVRKRARWPSQVAPVERLHSYVCRVHGEIPVDAAKLAQYVAESDERAAAWRESRGAGPDTPAPRWTYWANVVRDLT